MTMTKFSRINKQREEITMRVLEDMEKGGNEWKKPWVEASPLPPHNPVSGTQYSGRNFLYTYVYGMMRGYADPRWATEKQIKEMGWKIPENLQNGRGGINDELGVGIEHWGMYAYFLCRRFPGIAGDRLHHRPLRAGSRASGSRQGDRAEARYARKDRAGRPRRPQSLAQEGNGSRRVCPHTGRPRRPCEHAR